MALTPTEQLTESGPPCKKQRTFTNTPSELVKIFSAYVQAQAALLNKPDKDMESVLIMYKQAYSRKVTCIIATPRTALIPP